MTVRRTLQIARAEIQSFFDKKGRRPVVKEMPAVDGYLRRKHGSSLKKLCVEMELPKNKKRNKYDWSLEDAAKQVQTFHEEKGYRPTHADLPELDGFLRYHHDSSVRAIAESLSIPGGKTVRNSIQDAHEEVLKFYKDKKYRPIAHDMPGLNHWLITQHNSSVSKVCNELKIPGGRDFSRTMQSVEDEIQAFFDKNKRRPTKWDNRKDDAWLKHQGSSLSKLCDKMELPPASR